MEGKGISKRDAGLLGVLRHGDLLVVAVGLALLLGGWLLRSTQLGRTELRRFEGLALQVPTGWISLPGSGEHRLVLTELLSPETFKPRVTVSAEPLPAGFQPDQLRGFVELNLQGQLNLFHLIKAEVVTVDGHKGLRLDYAHAVNPVERADDPAATDIPVAVRASTLVLIAGKRLLRVDVERSVARNRRHPEAARALLASVKLEGGR